MVLLLLTWIIQYIVFNSAGSVARNLLERIFKEKFNLNIIQELILGLCFTGLLVTFLSLFVKISFVVFLVFFVLGMILQLKQYKQTLSSFKSKLLWLKSQNYFGIIIISIFSIFCLIYAVGEVRIFDTGLYHAQSIRWINEYSVVPGLGNLHSRFAFNSLFFPLQALFDMSFLQDGNLIIYGINSFFYFILIAGIINKLLSTTEYKNLLFYFFILVVATIVVLPRIQSPSPDIISFLLIIHIMLIFYEMDFSYYKSANYLFIYIFIITGFLVTVKLSNVPIVLFALVGYKMLNVKNILRFGVIFLLFLLPFITRNYFLSGYLVYPFPGIDIFNPDWKMPLKQAYLEIDAVKAWAIAPGEDPSMVLSLSFFERIKLWFSQLDTFSKVIVSANLPILLFIFGKARDKSYEQLTFGLIILVNLLYWFLSAPDPRFCLGLLCFNFAFSLSHIISLKSLEYQVGFLHALTGTLLVLIILAYSFFKLNYIREAVSKNLVFPQQLKKIEYTESNGIKVPNEPDGRCYNAELPCTCEKNDQIIYRSDKIEDGFKIKK